MPAETESGSRGIFAQYRGLIFPVLILGSVLIIVVPLPPLVLDMMLACNVTVSVIILLTTIYVKRPLEFSVFPAILLGTTLARLVLNVASTRLILSNGAENGTAAAGGVIQAFGDFVAGGQIAIGITIFIILIAIQFLVITKGATRISEVAARFALDGMPGKQMAIDADLNAGLLTQEQAKSRRAEVTQQADFYGAMDGASKFVRGDSIASIVITLINIIAGLAIGMLKYEMDFSVAAEVFTTLTIGDGLVTQVPAFLISLAAGLIVTRSSANSNLSGDVVGQLFNKPEAMFLACTFLVALSFTGLPPFPLMTLGIGCASIGILLNKKQQHVQVADKQKKEEKEQKKPEARPEDGLMVDPLELELGVGLIRLANPASGGDLLDRVTRVRHKIAQDLGLILPKVRIRDNIRLDQRQYQIKIRDIPVAGDDAFADGLLAIDTGATSGDIPGIETIEPAFNRPAKWIETSQRERAELMGYSVVEPSAVLITHLTEVVRDHSAELLTRQQVHQLLDNLKEQSPKVVDELIPEVLKTSQLHQVLSNLLRERVPIRDLEIILETLGNFADRTKDLSLLTEYVRHGLSRTICQQYRDRNRTLHVITIDPAIEDILAAGFDFGERGLNIKLSPQVAESVVQGIADELQKLIMAGHVPVILCSNPQIRLGLKHITTNAIPRLAVLSVVEITRDTNIESLGQLSAEALHSIAAAAS